MTNEKRLSLCYDAMREAAALTGSNDRDFFIHIFEKDPAGAAKSGIPILESLASIAQEAREALDKEKNGGGILQGLRGIVKAAQREKFAGVFSDSDGYTCAVSGYHAAKVRCDLPASIKKVEPWDGLHRQLAPSEDAHRIELPTVAEVKAFCAKNGVRASAHNVGRHPLPIDGGCRAVNPLFLLDMLRIFPNAEVYTADDRKSPIWFKSDDGGAGVLMPVNPREVPAC